MTTLDSGPSLPTWRLPPALFVAPRLPTLHLRPRVALALGSNRKGRSAGGDSRDSGKIRGIVFR